MVLNKPSEALGNHLEIIRILVLVMTTADDDASRSKFVSEVVFCCFTSKIVPFGLLKGKQLILVSKIILTDPYDCSFQRLAGQKKTIQVQSPSKFKSSLQRAGTRFNSKRLLHTNIAE